MEDFSGKQENFSISKHTLELLKHQRLLKYLNRFLRSLTQENKLTSNHFANISLEFQLSILRITASIQWVTVYFPMRLDLYSNDKISITVGR